MTRRLAVIYDADGGLLGELAYGLGKLMGTAHCAACDITYGALSEKAEWQACKVRLGLVVEQLHRNELPDDLARVVRGQLPCVAAEGDEGSRVLVDAAALEACAGRVEQLEARVRRALDQ